MTMDKRSEDYIVIFIDSTIKFVESNDSFIFTLENNVEYTIEKCEKDYSIFWKLFEKYPELYDELPKMTGGKARVTLLDSENKETKIRDVICQYGVKRSIYDFVDDGAPFISLVSVKKLDEYPYYPEHDDIEKNTTLSFIEKDNVVLLHPQGVEFFMYLKPLSDDKLDYIYCFNDEFSSEVNLYEITFTPLDYIQTLLDLIDRCWYSHWSDNKLLRLLYSNLCDEDLNIAYETIIDDLGNLYDGKMPITNKDINKRDIMAIVETKNTQIANKVLSNIVRGAKGKFFEDELLITADVLNVTYEELKDKIEAPAIKKEWSVI